MAVDVVYSIPRLAATFLNRVRCQRQPSAPTRSSFELRPAASGIRLLPVLVTALIKAKEADKTTCASPPRLDISDLAQAHHTLHLLLLHLLLPGVHYRLPSLSPPQLSH